MKRLLSIILLSISFLLFGQKKISNTKIFNSFPFNKAVKIKIVSYNLEFLGSSDSYVPPPLPPIKGLDSFIIKKIKENTKVPIDLKNIIQKENLNGITESKTLNLSEIYELSNVLFNTCGIFQGKDIIVSKCFSPSNAVLFIDEHDKVFEIFEICFECGGVKSIYGKNMFVNDRCDNFYEKVKSFFKKQGLQTDKIKRDYEKK